MFPEPSTATDWNWVPVLFVRAHRASPEANAAPQATPAQLPDKQSSFAAQAVLQDVRSAQIKEPGQAAAVPLLQVPAPSQLLGVSVAAEQVDPQVV
jgi:hypothetical protein